MKCSQRTAPVKAISRMPALSCRYWNRERFVTALPSNLLQSQMRSDLSLEAEAKNWSQGGWVLRGHCGVNKEQ